MAIIISTDNRHLQDVPAEIRDKWKGLRQRGDVEYMANDLGTSRPRVRQALNEGRATLRLQEQITEWYVAREESKKAAPDVAGESHQRQLEKLNSI